jgi:hypothetical protein
MKIVAVSRLILVVVIFAEPVPNGYAKDINFGWPTGEGWSSQPYKVASAGQRRKQRTIFSRFATGRLLRKRNINREAYSSMFNGSRFRG